MDLQAISEDKCSICRILGNSEMIYEDFNKRREQGNTKILGENFLPFKRFFALDTVAYSEGAISPKNKELMGLVASLVLRCNDCVLYHIEKSKEAGATREEINEAMNIALVVGGSIVIPHLRYAFEALSELFGESNSGEQNESI